MTSNLLSVVTCAIIIICHPLRNNRIQIFEILPISIFDLEMEGQRREEQRRRLHLEC